jgi:6-phosphogluconolactonase/glucosamine-6-phosphate isomerase/deaminase
MSSIFRSVPEIRTARDDGKVAQTATRHRRTMPCLNALTVMNIPVPKLTGITMMYRDILTKAQHVTVVIRGAKKIDMNGASVLKSKKK